MKITRTPTTVTLTTGGEPRAVFLAIGGVGIEVASVMLGFSALSIVGMVIGLLVTYVGVAFTGNQRIVIDADQIRAGRVLLPRQRTIAVRDIARVEAGSLFGPETGKNTYYVAAHPTSGAAVILYATHADGAAEEVAQAVRDALAATSSSTA